MITTDGPTAPLTAANRCDLCESKATTRAVLWSGGQLVFCDPHLRQYRPRLFPLTRRFEAR
ncbi:DUF7455 domain-containing protein [Actinophytocola sp.]|uniref:DUF7455 domain-containing protein n=1 Tax=Actinophytocola sp. TaxID=1872138 RepID=UPI002ED40676